MKSAMKMAAALFLMLLNATPVLAGDINLTVAASLKEVINELSDNFAKTHPGVKFRKNYGASGNQSRESIRT